MTYQAKKNKLIFVFAIFFATAFFTLNACTSSYQTVSSPPIKEQSATTPSSEEFSKEEFKEARYQQQLIISNKKDSFDKLMPIAFRILEANTDLCKVEENVISYGFYTDISQFLANNSRPVKPLTSSKNYAAPIEIVYVIPQSPADGKLKENDKILAVNDINLDGTLHENYTMLEQIFKKDSLRTSVFKIKRGDEILNINIQPVKICNYPIYLNQNGNINAYTDGHNIFINTSIVNIAKTPDKIALIVGHEMAHNEMLHIEKNQGRIILDNVVNSTVGILTGIPVAGMITKIGNKTPKGYEEEADYFGTYYAARAGYDISNSFEIWRQLAIENPSSLHLEGTTTHPSTAKRFLFIKRTVAEIQRKIQNGEPIEPSIEMVEKSKESVLTVNSKLLPYQ